MIDRPLKLYLFRCNRARYTCSACRQAGVQYGRMEFTAMFPNRAAARLWFDANHDYSEPPMIRTIGKDEPSYIWKGLPHFGGVDLRTGLTYVALWVW